MRHLICCAVAVALAAFAAAEDAKDKGEKETKEAEKTRKLLKKKISVEFKDTRFEETLNEIKDEVKGLRFVFGQGISRNRMITYKAKAKAVEDILADLCEKVGGIGYVVVSDPRPKASYNGAVQIRQGSERGYEKKKE